VVVSLDSRGRPAAVVGVPARQRIRSGAFESLRFTRAADALRDSEGYHLAKMYGQTSVSSLASRLGCGGTY